jgi:hypothetical protein
MALARKSLTAIDPEFRGICSSGSFRSDVQLELSYNSLTGIVSIWNAICMWEVSGTDEFADWYDSLNAKDQSKIDERVELLSQSGPALRRPVVGEITTSTYKNMKELRAKSGPAQLRVLFIFDPRREALLLLGGDKAEDSQWNRWYVTAVPAADALYENYLDETGQTDEEKN